MTSSISELQAMAGRFLTTADVLAWEATSQHRLAELVRLFQAKALDADGLRAALNGERLGTAPSTTPGGIAVIGLTGVLMPTPSIFSLLGFGTATREFTQQITAAMIDRAVKAIVVVVDSPGGSVRLVPEAAATMRMARERKPVIAAVVGTAASAAYWIASNATVIEATPSASVGAIGIIAERVSLVKALEQQGVDVRVITAGRFKSEGHPATPISELEQQALQRRVDSAYTSFVADIAAGRSVSATTVRTGYGEGRLVDAPDARRLGMIDRLATIDDTIARALASPSALTAIHTQRVEHARTTSERLRLDQARGEIAMHRERIDAAVRRSAMR